MREEQEIELKESIYCTCNYPSPGKTIEGYLFRALTLSRLIESRETSNYHRCGRTDRGVSASHQVISIDLRSNMLEGRGVFDYDGCRADQRNRREGTTITK